MLGCIEHSPQPQHRLKAWLKEVGFTPLLRQGHWGQPTQVLACVWGAQALGACINSKWLCAVAHFAAEPLLFVDTHVIQYIAVAQFWGGTIPASGQPAQALTCMGGSSPRCMI